MQYHFYNEQIRQQSITGLLRLLENEEISSEELVWAYTERMARYDRGDKGIHSVRELNPDAFQIARERDWERRKGELRGPLHGIPILLKDTIDTGDKMYTTCGSAALKNHRAAADAFIVQKLREAGAIILGKNHCTEFYGFTSLSAPNAYSGLLRGSTKNPFGPGRLEVGGSSGGSAASVAADFCVASIGTDTAGSILEPAYRNAVVGYKPTVGLTSRSGILPIMMCQDAAGPITKTVEDAARIAQIIIGRDEKDPDTIRATAFDEMDLVTYTKAYDLSGLRLGIVREAYYERMGEEAADLTDAALSRIAAAGAEIVEVEDFLPAKLLSEPEKHAEHLDYEVMYRAFKVRMDHYLSGLHDVPFSSLAGLIAWNRAHPEAIPLGQDYLELVEAKGTDGLISSDFIDGRMNDLMICGERGVWGAMENHTLDALILPGIHAQNIAATAGNPTITIPAGFGHKTGPVGLTLVGSLMGDAELLGIAAACERALPARPAPALP